MEGVGNSTTPSPKTGSRGALGDGGGRVGEGTSCGELNGQPQQKGIQDPSQVGPPAPRPKHHEVGHPQSEYQQQHTVPPSPPHSPQNHQPSPGAALHQLRPLLEDNKTPSRFTSVAEEHLMATNPFFMALTKKNYDPTTPSVITSPTAKNKNKGKGRMEASSSFSSTPAKHLPAAGKQDDRSSGTLTDGADDNIMGDDGSAQGPPGTLLEREAGDGVVSMELERIHDVGQQQQQTIKRKENAALKAVRKPRNIGAGGRARLGASGSVSIPAGEEATKAPMPATAPKKRGRPPKTTGALEPATATPDSKGGAAAKKGKGTIKPTRKKAKIAENDRNDNNDQMDVDPGGRGGPQRRSSAPSIIPPAMFRGFSGLPPPAMMRPAGPPPPLPPGQRHLVMAPDQLAARRGEFNRQQGQRFNQPQQTGIFVRHQSPRAGVSQSSAARYTTDHLGNLILLPNGITVAPPAEPRLIRTAPPPPPPNVPSSNRSIPNVTPFDEIHRKLSWAQEVCERFCCGEKIDKKIIEEAINFMDKINDALEEPPGSGSMPAVYPSFPSSGNMDEVNFRPLQARGLDFDDIGGGGGNMRGLGVPNLNQMIGAGLDMRNPEFAAFAGAGIGRGNGNGNAVHYPQMRNGNVGTGHMQLNHGEVASVLNPFVIPGVRQNGAGQVFHRQVSQQHRGLQPDAIMNPGLLQRSRGPLRSPVPNRPRTGQDHRQFEQGYSYGTASPTPVPTSPRVGWPFNRLSTASPRVSETDADAVDFSQLRESMLDFLNESPSPETGATLVIENMSGGGTPINAIEEDNFNKDV